MQEMELRNMELSEKFEVVWRDNEILHEEKLHLEAKLVGAEREHK